MLVLKGDKYKSLIVEAMMSRGSVCTIAYADFFMMFDAWVVDSNEYGIDELIETIEEINKENIKNNEDILFLVIYTNEKEEELGKLFEWIEVNRSNLRCSQVLVTCK